MNEQSIDKQPRPKDSIEVDPPTVITSATSHDDTVETLRGPLANYTIVEEIARGGMGIVYRARQINADRDVALKVVRGNDPDPKEVKRFLAEARAAARLDHPNIVPVYDVGQFEGQPFFSMRLIGGQSLSRRLDGTPLDCREAAGLLRTVCNAIQYAHEQQIVHRDIKPGNILLDDHQRPYVTDFGLARILDSPSDLTATGQMVGTPSYMPPEQALGQRDLVDIRSDVYSLGAVLYACLTGRPPFQAATSMATVMQLLSREPVSPRALNPDIDSDVETICLKCLEKDPERRYQSAGELTEELDRYLTGIPIQARPASLMERSRKWIRRHPAMAGLIFTAAIAVASAVLAGVTGFYYVGVRTSLHETETARGISESERRIATAALRDAELANRKAEDSDYFRKIALAQSAWDAGNIQSMSEYLDATRKENRRWEYDLLFSMLNRHTDELPCPGGCMHLPRSSAGSGATVSFTPGLTIQFFDPQTGRMDPEWKLGPEYQDCSFRADFRQIAVQCLDTGEGRRLEVLDTESREKLLSVGIPPALPQQVADEELRFAILMNTSPYQTIAGVHVVDLHEGRSRVLDATGMIVRRALFTADGKELIVGGRFADSKHGILRKYSTADWSLLSEKQLPLGVIPGDMRFVTRSSASRGDAPAEFLTSCEDFRIRRINLKSLEVVAESQPFRFRLNAIDYSPTLGRVAAGLSDGQVLEFDVETLRVQKEHPGHRLKATSVLYSNDGSRLWSGSHENRILCWNSQTDKPPKALKQHTEKIRHVAFSSDGSLIASCQTSPPGTKDMICIWSRETGELIHSLPRSDQQESGHSWGSYCVEFFEQDQKLVSFGVDRTVRCWNVADGSLLQTATTPHTSAILAGTISNDRQQAFSVARDGMLSIWNLQSFSLHTAHQNIPSDLLAVAIDPTDRHILVGGIRMNGSNAVLRDLETPQSAQAFLGVDREIHAVTFSPDGSYFVCGGSWGDIRAIDSQTQQILWEGSQHINNVQQIAFTPDGTRMVTVGLDHRVILWDPKNGQPILNLRGHTAGVHAAAFSPDGKVLVTAGDDQQLLLWDGEKPRELATP